ncbi:Mechanosensitive (MS) ion channel [Parvularcula bermudensis HTCC2503]|uniref:Mechanosensitive (MS) ion channel n=1 Tax=Parvularcula bermudensis (strain ATCC BAA-594 / HTCC2503 / KCTC 12087) TaxID=314260 RepID=E0TCJ7_PARBH|nr:mechanosensitive ion channel domain-containing protein [Parvularcula bermudensis]ADM08586.1 Mechanosensitive (MS) ion channel [Parvularcula bermudensis HTCC2503]
MSLWRLFMIAVLWGGIAAAQPGMGGQDEGTGAYPEGHSGGVARDMLDALGSGSKLLIGKIQTTEKRDPIDDPRFNGQDSPRATVMTFLNAMDLVGRGYVDLGFERAMACFPPGTPRTDAVRLYGVFLRLGPVSPVTLPGGEGVQQSGDTRFEYFPRGSDHIWVWRALDTAPPANSEIAVQRYGEGTWLFSEATLSGLEALSEAMEPLPPRYGEDDGGAYFIRAFSPLVEETGVRGWFLFLATTGLGVLAGIGIHRGVRWLSLRSRRQDHGMVAMTLNGLGITLGIFVFTVAFAIAMGFLTLGPVFLPLKYELPRFLLLTAFAMLVISGIDTITAFAHRNIQKTGSGHYDRMVVTIVRRILRTVVITIFLIFVLENVLGVNVGALILGFGVVGLALGLAAQDSVKNLFGAVTIFLNRPFFIGDWIQFGGRMDKHWGVVEDIKLQATKLRDLHGNIVTIPNMLFIDREVENLSARGFIRREMSLALPYRPDTAELDRAVEALNDILTSDEVMADARAQGRDADPHISFYGFEESWLSLRIYHYYFMDEGRADDLAAPAVQRDTERGWFTYLDHISMVNRRIVDVFGERDITFAFPRQTVEFLPDKSFKGPVEDALSSS